MKCDKCGRENLTAKELAIHNKYFHKTSGQQAQVVASSVCPDCGSTLYYQEGCTNCPACGFSKCG